MPSIIGSSVGASTFGGTASYTLTLSPTAGSSLVLLVCETDGSGSSTALPTVSGGGSSWTMAAASAYVSFGVRASIWYSHGVSGGSQVITVTKNSTSDNSSATLVNFALLGSPDVTLVTNGSALAKSIGPTATTTIANQVVFALLADSTTSNGGTSPPNTGYTQLQNWQSPNIAHISAYKIVSSTGTQSADWGNTTASSQFGAAIVTFPDAGATATTLTGPTSGTIGVASSNFTVGANGPITGTVVITPSDSGAGGTFTPTTVSINTGSPTGTFTYTPASGGNKTISTTNGGGLSNPASIAFTVPFALTMNGGIAYGAIASGAIADTVSVASGPTAYTLTALAGTYSLTGGSAVLTKTSGAVNYTLTALAGSYALTGGTASLKVGRRITALAGSYSLTGGTATLKVARTLVANAGTYSITGSSATLTKSTGSIAYTLTALAGSYSLTGGTASLSVGRKLTANAGTYALTGGNASLSVGRKITALAGSYSITGGSAVLTKTGVGPTAYTLTALAGSYSITGGSATLTWSGESARSYSNEVELKPRRFYVRRGKQILLFNSAEEADQYIEAQELADKAIQDAQRTSRRARKRLRDRVVQVEPLQTVDIPQVAQLVNRFDISVDLPKLIEQQAWERVMQIHALAMELQDEEEVLMLLLA